ncbi:ketosteroid isomerase-related protein [uncultured Roseobacter sp.]|uniref:ketosteroid isomerase-related protein n=1 Tax=uncultured Roseobacter sp. TaxID=114847 RepID=UPI00262FD86B|nr:ketosteroid isomerase-related protein [uncultured Roseobacter sp.]
MSNIIKTYFDAFNAKNIPAMLACLSEDVAHHVNGGDVRVGKKAFADFCAHMSRCYDETLVNMVIFDTPDHGRAAAEYVVNGRYLKTDTGLPEAHGQRYTLPAGSFFDVSDGLITRVTTRYNLNDWIKQVS